MLSWGDHPSGTEKELKNRNPSVRDATEVEGVGLGVDIPVMLMKNFISHFCFCSLILFGAVLSNGTQAHAASADIAAGQTVTLTAAADGTAPFTYQWYKNNVMLAGFTDVVYTITNFQATNAGSYTVVISNSAGTTTSEAAVLSFAATATTPIMTTQPASQTVTAGNGVTFAAAASGSPTPTYQWRKGGANISGATSAIYTIASTVLGDAGSYTVVATNSAGSVTSNVAVLTVNSSAITPVITTQPTSQTVTSGSSVTFTVSASGSPAPTYQWRKGGTNISGATSATYTIASTVLGDAGSYTVVATNTAGSVTSNAAVLTVNTPATAPVITTQPVSQTVTSGSSVTFTVSASGSPAPTFRWRKGYAYISGATSDSYTISGVTAADAGTYRVVVTNSAGSVTSSTVALTVNEAPAIITQPASQTVATGSAVTFAVTASGTPTPGYQWQKGGTNISGATNASYTVSNATTASADTYRVVVTNSAGSITSSNAVLTVNVAPAITTQPASQTVTAGGAVTFTAAASGTPTPTYQWRKSGVNISGATSASYAITSTVTGDAGAYTVVASNSVGAVTSSTATLTVNAANSAPVFTVQPASQMVSSGDSVTLTAAASGTPTPTFQWRKNGVNISGATNASYTISSATSGSSALYSVVATNSAGSVTSGNALLTVVVAPSNATIVIAVQD